MEDISTLVWIGIAIIWFLSRFVRRGARKAAGKPSQPERPAAARREAPRTRIEMPAATPNRSGTGPPPIEPR